MRFPALVLSSLLLSGTFAAAQTGFSNTLSYVTPNTALRSADFNGDGHPDLLLYSGTGNASIAPNLGAYGQFGSPTSWSGSVPLQAAQIGDLNGDGRPDIVGCSSGNLYAYVNIGPGQFATPTPVSLTNGCNSISLGDVNGDGKLDIIVTGSTGGGAANRGARPNNSIQVYFGDGTGHFTAGPLAQNINLDSTRGTANITQCALTDAVTGDFLGNGTVSLVADAQCFPATQTTSNPNPTDTNSTVFLGRSNAAGNFTFTELTESSAYYQLQNTESNSPRADLNHDGRPDLLFTTSSASVITGLNSGGGNFTFNRASISYQTSDTVSPYVYGGVAAADFNRDGVIDLVSAFNGEIAASGDSGHGSTDFGNYFSVLYGSPAGTYSGNDLLHYGDGDAADLPALLVGDFNSDGLDDFAAISFNSDQNQYILNVYRNIQQPSATCYAPTQANANIICQPPAGQTEGSPVTVTAASNVAGFTLNRLYLDNTSVYQVASQQVSTNVTAGPGTHTLALVSYNNKGQAFTTRTSFTVSPANGSGCLPSVSGVAICAPAQGTTAHSPVTFTAGATAPNGSGTVAAIRVYVDSVALFTANNPNYVTNPSFQVSQSAAVAPGTHNLVVVAYLTGGNGPSSITASETFTVAGATPCYPSSAGAMICSPARGATTSSPFTLSAGATAAAGYLTAIRLYSDNVAQTLVNNPGQTKSFAITPSVSLAAGTHNLVIVGYDSTGHSVSASETVTIK